MLGKTKIITAVVAGLVGMVVAVPVLQALFASTGPFASLVTLPTAGALSSNAYSGILSAVIGLTPLALIGGAGFYFWNMWQKRGSGKRGRKRKTTRRSRGRARPQVFLARAGARR